MQLTSPLHINHDSIYIIIMDYPFESEIIPIRKWWHHISHVSRKKTQIFHHLLKENAKHKKTILGTVYRRPIPNRGLTLIKIILLIHNGKCSWSEQKCICRLNKLQNEANFYGTIFCEKGAIMRIFELRSISNRILLFK